MRAADDVPNITYNSRHGAAKGALDRKAANTVSSHTKVDFTSNGQSDNCFALGSPLTIASEMELLRSDVP